MPPKTRRNGKSVKIPDLARTEPSYQVQARIPKGIKFDFAKLRDNRSISFKDDTVRYYKMKADAVAYVGDGRWDLHALRNADLRFAIKNSKLAELCKEQEIQTTIVADFKEVVTFLQKKMSERDSWQRESE